MEDSDSKSTEKKVEGKKRTSLSIGQIKQRREQKRKVTLVRKANDLVEARYRFNIWEVRVFTKLLTLLRPDDKEFVEHKINILDIIRDFGLESNKANYKWVKEGARGLMSKIIDMVITAEDGKPEDLMIPLLTKFKGRNDPVDGSYIKLSFSPEMKPFLLELRQRYLQYEFKNVANLRSPYYVRIYELLKQYEKIGNRRIELRELRTMLGIRDEYREYGIFKRKILENSRENINAFTDIRFSYEEQKQGKSVVALVFHIFPNHTPRPEEGKSALLTRKLKKAATAPGTNLFSQPEDLEAETLAPDLFPDYTEKLAEWWGVSQEEFFRRAEGKSSADIEQAINFTKNRIRSGKAHNPAGVFLDALKRGHFTPDQLKARKAEERQLREKEKQARLQPLVARYESLLDNYSAAINDLVRSITHEHPEVTEEVIADIKTTHRLLGDRKIESYTIEDFRKNPTLRGMVIAGIMRRFSEQFDLPTARIQPQIEEVKAQIRSIEPGFNFR